LVDQGNFSVLSQSVVSCGALPSELQKNKPETGVHLVPSSKESFRVQCINGFVIFARRSDERAPQEQMRKAREAQHVTVLFYLPREDARGDESNGRIADSTVRRSAVVIVVDAAADFDW